MDKNLRTWKMMRGILPSQKIVGKDPVTHRYRSLFALHSKPTICIGGGSNTRIYYPAFICRNTKDYQLRIGLVAVGMANPIIS